MAKSESDPPNRSKSMTFSLKKASPRFKEYEQILRFPHADPRPEGPLGLPADVDALGYVVKFTDRIIGGYKVNILRDDGSVVKRGVKIRRFWMENGAKDPLLDNEVSLRLSFNLPAELRMTIYGEGEITKKKVEWAIGDLSNPDKEERMAAAELLGKACAQGFDIKDAIFDLAKCLADFSRGVRVNAAWALGEYAKRKGDIGKAEPALVAAIEHEHGSTRRSAARALMHHYVSIVDIAKSRAMLEYHLPDVREVANGVKERRSV